MDIHTIGSSFGVDEYGDVDGPTIPKNDPKTKTFPQNPTFG